MKKFSVLTLIIFISCGAESTTSTVVDTTTTVLDTITTTVADTTTATVLDTTTSTVTDTTTTSTVAETTTTTVAKALSPFLDDEIIRVFPASDLQQETVDLTIQYTNEAYDLWMADDYLVKAKQKLFIL